MEPNDKLNEGASSPKADGGTAPTPRPEPLGTIGGNVTGSASGAPASPAPEPIDPRGASADVMPINPYHTSDGAPQQGRTIEPAHFAGKKPKKKSKAPVIALGVFAFLLAAVYGAGVWAFSNICYPNTFVADTDVSLMRRPTAVQRIKSSAEGYKLTVEGEGFEWSYTPESASDIVDAEEAVDHVIAANEPLKWPVRLYHALMQTESSSAAAPESLKDLDIADIELPEDFDLDTFKTDLDTAVEAYNAERTGVFDGPSAYDAEAGKLTLEKAHANRKLDPAYLEKAALLAVSQLNKKVALDDTCFAPLVNGASDKQLESAINAANEFLGTNINLKMGGATVATLDGGTLVGWMTFDDALNPTLNTDLVETWVSDLAKTKLDTRGTNRIYARPDGKQINVSGGTYGWVSNEAELIALVQDAVATKKTGDIEVPTKQQADKYTDMGQPDWGAYVDIDLSEQYARYYDASGNVLWESHIISGNPNTDHASPTGIYKLNRRDRDQTLIGADENKDNKPDYETPVAYWMPFVGNSVGLHDAGWQSSASFNNPNAYTYTGSHGCINLPPAKAAELFDIIQIGVCVISHY